MTDPAIQRTMVKNVKIHAPIAIKTVKPTIYGDIDKISMSPATILKCLIGRATVWEILSDGSLLKLNNHNYNTVNSPATVYADSKVVAKDVDKSAPATEEVNYGTKTMILKDSVLPKEEVDIAPGTVESLNDKIKEAGEVPAPKMETPVEEEPEEGEESAEVEGPSDAKEDDPSDDEASEEEMTDEEKELAELQAQIDALDEEEKASK